jgi:hypothetical protein
MEELINYLKKLFNDLSKGTKRIHYLINVLFAITFIVCFMSAMLENNSLASFLIVLSYAITLIIYWLIVFITLWIREGFKEG